MRSGAWTLFLVCAAWSTVHATTLTEAIRRGWQEAPLFHDTLAADQELLDVSRLERWQRLLPNEPQVFYATTDNKTAEIYGITETFGFPGKAFAYRPLDKAKEESQEAEGMAKRYDITVQIVQAYLDGAVALATVDQQKRNIEDAETLASSLRARYEAGLAAQAEVIGSDLQIRQQRADLNAAEDHARVSLSTLRKLLNLDRDPETLELPDDLEESIVDQLGNRTADERRAMSAAQMAAANRRLSWWAQAPDLSLGAQRNYYSYLPGSPSGELYTYNYTIAITAPIFFPFYEWTEAKRQKNQAILDEKAAMQQLVSAESDRLEAEAEFARSRKRLQEVRENDLPLAEALMESTLSAYRSGKLGYAELTLARKPLNDLRAQDIQLRRSIISSHLRCLKQKDSAYD